MKKIRKTYSGVVPNGKVLNSENASLQDTYSCDYLNRNIPDTKDLGKIVVDDITCKNMFTVDDFIKAGWWNEAFVNKINNNSLTVVSENNQQWDNVPFSFSDKIEVGKIYTISSKGVPASFTIADIETISSRTENDVYIRTFKALAKGVRIKWLADNYPSVASDIQLESGQYTSFTPHKEFSNKQIYSMEEQVIGTWIDDKPIYKKTYHGTTTFDLDESSQLLIPASVNVDKIINCSGYLTENSGNNVLTVNEVRIVKVADNRVLFQSTNNNLKNCPYAITFEYTKTTD